ncbi:MAG: T9SS type A sorting domain-containing protein [Bacteroidota bacterium]
MKKTSKLFNLLLGLLLSFPLLSQSEPAPCGTDLGISPWLRDFQSRINETPRNDDLLYLPVKVHIVGTDEGNGYFSRNAVLNAFCTLNFDFLETNIQFFLDGDFNYINNSDYYEHDFGTGAVMMNQNNFPNTINCYIVEDPAGNCGYFFPGPDAVALNKGCTQPNDHTWSHEIGHYLSLPHPFRGWEGEEHDYSTPAPNSWGNRVVERVDGSNCTFAGDGFCDTAPDYLNYRWPCNADGVSTVQQTDPNGETFVSDGSLFMSYSNDSCPYRFSDDQTAAMRANVEEVRPNLITVPPVAEDIPIESPEEITVINPEEGSLVETSSITLEWEAVPNVTHYVLQINPFNIFSIVFEEQLIQGTTATVTDLEGDETYYWRVRPFNPYETCTEWTSAASFNTGTLVSTNDLSANEVFELYPNPVTNGELQMNIRLEDTDAINWRLMDATGSLLLQDDLGSAASLQRIAMPVADLAAGVYFVQILTAERQLVRKVLVQ